MKFDDYTKRITAILCAGFVKHIILSAIITLGAIISNAETITINGYTWSYDLSGGAVTITRVSLSEGNITIPSVIGGSSVTSIGSYAFSCCSALASVTISDSVTSIGEDAFYNCGGQTGVDRGAIEAAFELNFPYGGLIPKGRTIGGAWGCQESCNTVRCNRTHRCRVCGIGYH